MADDRISNGVAVRGVAATALMVATFGLSPSASAQTTPHGDVSGSTHTTSAVDTRVDQIGASDAGSPARIDQQAPSGADAAPPAEQQVASDDLPEGTVAQLGEPEKAHGVDQVAEVGKTATVGPQLSNGERSTTAAAPLSTPAEGKPEGVVRLEGKDRCDPNSSQADTPACAHAIETRAAEFTRPSPTELTPEQRLLIRQANAANAASTQMALRRIGRNEVNAEDLGAQSVASIVLAQPEPPPSAAPDPTQDVNPDVLTEAIVESIVQGLQQ